MTTTCTTCGVEIQASTAEATGGDCVPVAKSGQQTRTEQKKGIEIRSRTIPSETLDLIRQSVDLIDIESVKRLRDQATIDDAAMVSLDIPCRRFSECLLLFAFEYYVKKGLIPDDALLGYNTTRRTWDAIDRIAPYSLREHWK
jgi:hypothetical protein